MRAHNFGKACASDRARGKGVLCALSLLAALSCGANARARESVSEARASLQVSGPSACVSVASLRERVAARSPRIAFVEPDPAWPALEAQVTGASAREASLSVRWPDGRRFERRLSVSTCREANDALAFLIALTLDPEKRAGETAESASAELPAAAAVPAPSAVREAVVIAPVSAQPTAAAVRTSERSAAIFDHAALEALAHLQLGAAPSALIGPSIAAWLVLRDVGWWAPALQLRAAIGFLEGYRAADARADFRLADVGLAACPVALRWQRLTARACATGALGSLFARGSGGYAPRARSRLWLEVGASVSAAVALTSRVQVRMNAGLSVPFRRDRYAFRPDVFHRVASVCVQLDLGLGMRFW